MLWIALSVLLLTGRLVVGSKGGGQTVGYKYFLGVQHVLCQSPIDGVVAIKFEDKIAWAGMMNNGSIVIDNESLFGGSGSEGGVSGQIDIMGGSPTQATNDYLVAKQPPSDLTTAITNWLTSFFPIFKSTRTGGFGLVPAYRGVVQAVFRQLYIGNNPFLKPVRYKLQNVYSTLGSWYPAKAPIGDVSSANGCAIYIAIDASLSMSGEKLAKAKAAVATVINSLKGTQNSVEVVFFNSTIASSLRKINASSTDYDALVAYVEGYSTVAIGTDFNVAVSDANSFFTAAQAAADPGFTTNLGLSSFQLQQNYNQTGDASQTALTNFVLLVTDGAANPTTSAASAAATIAAMVPVPSVYCFNIDNTNTTYTAQVDNTPVDGVPVLNGPYRVYTQSNSFDVVLLASPTYTSYDLSTLLGKSEAEIDALATAGVQVYAEASMTATLAPIAGGGPANGTWSVNVVCQDGSGTTLVPIEGAGATSQYIATAGGGVPAVTFTLPVGTRTVLVGATAQPLTPIYTTVAVQSKFWQLRGPSVDNLIGALSAAIGGWVDINPAHMMRDLLISPLTGGSGNANDIGTSFTDAADTLYDEGFGLSLENASPSDRDTFKSTIESHIDASAYFDETTGKWEIKLIRDDYVVADLTVFDETTIMEFPTQPVRPRQEDIPNQITITYTNRFDGGSLSVTVTNTAAVQMIGAVIPEKRDYPGITSDTLAKTVAGRDLATVTVPLWAGSVRVTEIPAGFNLGTPFVINYPKIGMNSVVCRATEITIGDGKDNSVIVQFTEDTYGKKVDDQTGTIATTENPDYSALPPNFEFVEEAPYWVRVMESDQTTVDAELVTDPDSGFVMATCDKPSDMHRDALLVRYDAPDWTAEGIATLAPYAKIEADLAAGADTTTFTIPYTSMLNFVNKNDLLVIDEEIMRIDNMTIASGTVTVTVGRGCLDTVPVFHATGAAVMFWWPFVTSDGVSYTAGETKQFKLLPRTSKETEPEASVTAKSVTFDSRAIRPYPVGKLQIGGVYLPTGVKTGTLTATWAHRDRLLQTTDPVDDFTASSIGPEAGDAYYAVRRTRERIADMFALTDIFAGTYFFLGVAGTEVEYPISGTPTTIGVSTDDADFFYKYDFFSETDVFADPYFFSKNLFSETDFFEGAFTQNTLLLELGIRTKRGGYTDWQTPFVDIVPLLPPIDLMGTTS